MAIPSLELVLEDARGHVAAVRVWCTDSEVSTSFEAGNLPKRIHRRRVTGPVVPRLAELRNYYSYFQNLGVNCIYFGPLFESSSHGYDTVDHYKVDRRLGDLALLKEVVSELHDRGIRVLFDGVFNHTGVQHKAFEHLVTHGPAESEYAGWYRIGARRTDHTGWVSTKLGNGKTGFAYDCWEGHPKLPRLDLTNPDVKQYIFQVKPTQLITIARGGD